MSAKGELILDNTVKIDATLNVDNLSEAFTVEHEDTLLDAKGDATSRLNERKAAHSELAMELTKQGKQLVEEYKSDDAQALATALAGFLSEPYGIYLQTTKVDIEKKQVEARVRVMTQKEIDDKSYEEDPSGYRYRSSSDWPEVSKVITVAFGPTMLDLVAQMAAVSEEIAVIVQEVEELESQLVDIPRTTRRVKAQLVRATLEGRLTDGPSLLTALEDASKPKTKQSRKALTHKK